MADADATIGWDNRDFKRGAREATRTLDRFESGFTKTFKSISLLTRGGAIGAGLFALGGALKSIGEAGFDVEDITAGLNAVSDGTESTAKQIRELRELAKKPGLGFEEAAKGSINLQAVGIQADLSRRLVGGFGNALASVGKGRAELDGVTTALTQIASKGKISAEELNQIAERVPQIRTVLKSAFGTAVAQDIEALNLSATQFFEGLSRGLDGLPQAADTGRNSVENLKDAFEELKFELDATLGVSEKLTSSNGILTKTLRELSTGLSLFRNGLVGETDGETLGRMLGGVANSSLESIEESRQARLRAAKDAEEAEAKLAKEQAEAAKKQEETLKRQADSLAPRLEAAIRDSLSMDKELEFLENRLNSILFKAGAEKLDDLNFQRKDPFLDAGDGNKLTEAYIEALKVTQDIAKLREKIAADEDRAAESAKRAADLKKEEAESKLAESQSLAARREEFAITQEILKLRARGNNEEADAMQKNLDLQREAAEIAKQLGISQEQALGIAKQTAELQEKANAPQLNALQKAAKERKENRGLDAKPEFKGLDALEKLQERKGNNGIINGVAEAAAAGKKVPAGVGKNAELTVAEKQLVAAERAATALENITAE